MPDDRDFKKLVRARMEQTGERYTQARSQLRPEAAPGKAPEDPDGVLGAILPTTVDILIGLRAERVRLHEALNAARATKGPVGALESGPPRPGGPPWELRVLAGGPLGEVGAPSLPLAHVAALGTALQGVGFVTVGLDLRVPAPEGTTPPEDTRFWFPPASSYRPVREAHAQLLALMRERAGFTVPPETDGRVIPGHRSRIALDGAGAPWLLALSKTDVMIRPGDTGVIDFEALLEREEELRGRVWAGYGVIVLVERDFLERPVPEGLRGRTPFSMIDVEMSFWTSAGATLTAAASGADLPSWSLQRAWLEGLTLGTRYGITYRGRWGHYHS